MSKIIEITNESNQYTNKYGWHFNKSLCDYAVSLMTRNHKATEPLTKEYIDSILDKYEITLVNNIGWDYIFVANMCKADYYGSSIIDEKHFALYIKDTIDDEDASNEITMRRWYATMQANNIDIDFNQYI